MVDWLINGTVCAIRVVFFSFLVGLGLGCGLYIPFLFIMASYEQMKNRGKK